MKNCSSCGELKPLDHFQKRKASKDGLTASCKGCLKIRDKAKHDKKATSWCRVPYVNIEPRAAYVMRNGRKRYAHEQLNYAVKVGKVLKREKCERCGNQELVHGHHDDYNKPLIVMWLCPKCHKQRHRELETKWT